MVILTKKQKDAVESKAATTLVIAGPGTGKTHILASRVQFLVEQQNVNPENILCLTYSNAGATAMKTRILSMLRKKGIGVTTSTFHAFASSILEEHPIIFGYGGNLQPVDDVDQAITVKNLIDTLYSKGKIRALTTTMDRYYYRKKIIDNITTLKSEGISPDKYIDMVGKWQEEYQKEFDNMPDERKIASRGKNKGEIKSTVKKEFERTQEHIRKNKEFLEIYREYENTLKQKNFYDYADMINRANRGLEASPETRDEIQEQYTHILVDEYQDTNKSQNQLLFHLLATEQHNCFVVGDDDQAIHRFQGATIENFTDFLKTFPKTNIVSLEDNFRSPQFILDSALDFIGQNETRINHVIKVPPKKLIARGETAKEKTFLVQHCNTDIEEHHMVAEQIEKYKKQRVPLDEIAIITRNNKEQEPFARALYARSIPYTMSGNQNALEHVAVIAFMKILQTCQNPNNSELLVSFLRHPATPILIEDTIAILASRARNRTTVYEELKKASRQNQMVDTKAIQKTLRILHSLAEKQESETGASWLNLAFNETGYKNWVASQEDAIDTLENISALFKEAQRVQESNPSLTIRDILNHLNSFSEVKIPLRPRRHPRTTEKMVQILTAHQAKGREFDVVFIVNSVQRIWGKDRNPRNTLPLHNSIAKNDTNKEDERRLFFVALTRAKKRLIVSYATTHSDARDKPRDETHSEFVEALLEANIPLQEYTSKNLKPFVEQTLLISEAYKHPNTIKEIVGSIVASPSFSLNATNINTFSECPNKFLYQTVLRIPGTKSQSLVYGSAIHYALQRYFEVPATARSKAFLFKTAKESIEQKSTLTEAENNEMIERAKKVLAIYHKTRLQKEDEPLFVEKGYKAGEISYNTVQLTGKIDKITPIDRGAKEVKVVDYKTNKKAKTPNEILGKTKATEGDTSLYDQLMFYKLLLEIDTSFPYKPTQFVLDFVDAQKEVVVPIDDKDYDMFTKKLQAIWKSIQSLSFLESANTFPFCQECEYCVEK